MTLISRDIVSNLLEWKSSATRKPLIVRGARQVGKSCIIEHFGKEYFEQLLTINFEFESKYISCFDTLDPQQIINQIEILADRKVTQGQTLLFLDEIQECPRAILALRYFKELMPDLHVIAAGSLLEFVLEEESFSFPVGRVQFMYLGPVSFSEFLIAQGSSQANEYLNNINISDKIPEAIHLELLEKVKHYCFTGGMPEVVDHYINHQSFRDCQILQNSILATYQRDFGKYAKKAEIKHLKNFFDKAPNLVAKDFKYVLIDRETRSRELKVALDQLCYAGLLHRVHATTAAGIPLRYHIKENKFKLLYLDIGLLQRTNQIDILQMLQSDIIQLNHGSLAEQFVGQELLAYHSKEEEKHLYYWVRERKGSSAEVDYVININSQIIPIEVKAGKTGRLRSLQQFMQEKKSPFGVRMSQSPFEMNHHILSVPFYLIRQLPRLLAQLA